MAPLIDKTPEFETRAAEDVAQLGTFPAPWPDKLTVLRAYILVCLENLADEADTFSAKLARYVPEYKAALQAAREAANAGEPGSVSTLTLALERH